MDFYFDCKKDFRKFFFLGLLCWSQLYTAIFPGELSLVDQQQKVAGLPTKNVCFLDSWHQYLQENKHIGCQSTSITPAKAFFSTYTIGRLINISNFLQDYTEAVDLLAEKTVNDVVWQIYIGTWIGQDKNTKLFEKDMVLCKIRSTISIRYNYYNFLVTIII